MPITQQCKHNSAILFDSLDSTDGSVLFGSNHSLHVLLELLNCLLGRRNSVFEDLKHSGIQKRVRRQAQSGLQQAPVFFFNLGEFHDHHEVKICAHLTEQLETQLGPCFQQSLPMDGGVKPTVQHETTN